LIVVAEIDVGIARENVRFEGFVVIGDRVLASPERIRNVPEVDERLGTIRL
jgi:hypothetical protein